MALPIVFNNVVYQAGFFGTDDGAAKATVNLDDTYSYPVTINGTVTGPGSTVTLTYTLPGSTTPMTQTITATQFDNADMIEFTGIGLPDGQTTTGSYRYILSNKMVYGSNPPPPAGQTRTTFVADGNNTLGDYMPVCYAAGTRLLALRDGVETEIEVEALSIGDLVVTASGEHRAIRWIGTRAYSGVFANRHPHILPVRFAAGSLGENVPSRDLVVSPKHAMVLDGMLIPAEALVNGRTITKAKRIDSVEYFHVELDSHDVLVAEGAASESYIEDDNRGFFHNVADYRKAGLDDVIEDAVYCLPRVEDGYALEGIRQRLSARADALLGPVTDLHEANRAA